MLIINENGREMNVGSTGFQHFVENRKKYHGRLKDALRKFGWEQAALLLSEEAGPMLKEVCQDLFPTNVRVTWSFDGIAGPYSAETYPKHRGVTLNLTAFTDSHLAKSPTVSSTVFPSTHAQAGVDMVVMDIQSQAFKNGAFASENELVDFIRERLDLVKAALKTFAPIDGSGGASNEDDDDDDGEDQEAA